MHKRRVRARTSCAVLICAALNPVCTRPSRGFAHQTGCGERQAKALENPPGMSSFSAYANKPAGSPFDGSQLGPVKALDCPRSSVSTGGSLSRGARYVADRPPRRPRAGRATGRFRVEHRLLPEALALRRCRGCRPSREGVKSPGDEPAGAPPLPQRNGTLARRLEAALWGVSGSRGCGKPGYS